MARKKQASFKMKGHTLPGINQKSGTGNLKDGRSSSSAFQQKHKMPDGSTMDGASHPGSSPLESGWLGKAANIMTGGLSGGIGKAMKGDWKGAIGSVASGGLSSLAGSGGGLKEKMAQKVDSKVDEAVEGALEGGE